MALTGQGYDCNWGTDFSSSNFGIILPKSGKNTFSSNLKELTDGNGEMAGYKFYRQKQEASLVFEPAAVSGNTGTVAAKTLLPGATITVSSATNSHYTGSWSVKSFEDASEQEGELVQTANIFRYAGITPV